jgi:hypothetical protein
MDNNRNAIWIYFIDLSKRLRNMLKNNIKIKSYQMFV